jgi:hypothetical protein
MRSSAPHRASMNGEGVGGRGGPPSINLMRILVLACAVNVAVAFTPQKFQTPRGGSLVQRLPSSSSALSLPASLQEEEEDFSFLRTTTDEIERTDLSLLRCDAYRCERQVVKKGEIFFTSPATNQVMLIWDAKPKSVLVLLKVRHQIERNGPRTYT